MNISTEGIKQICNAWGLSDCTVKLIKQSENHTYLVQETQEEGDNKSSHKCFILRLTPQDHRSQKAIQAELDYINLIHRSNVPLHLCVPIPLCGSNANEEEEFIALVTPYEAEADKNKEWFAVLFEHAKVLQMVRFFEEDGLGLGKIEGFNADRFRDTFLTAYRGVFPAMVEAGHMEPHMLMGFELYREFFHTAVAVDILFQAEKGKVFENSITSFCEVVVKRFQSKFTV